MVANYPFIVIAEIFDDGTRIIEECGHDGKFEHNSRNVMQYQFERSRAEALKV